MATEPSLEDGNPSRAVRASLSVAIVAAILLSSATWISVTFLKTRYPQPDDLVRGGSLAMLVVAGGMVGSLASLLLWQTDHHRPRWLILGGGLFVAACSEALLGLHQMQAADSALGTKVSTDPAVLLRAPENFFGDLPTMALLGTIGGVLWLGLILAHRHVTGRRIQPLAVLIGLIVGSFSAWAASAVLGTWIPQRNAGIMLSVSCLAGSAWLVHHLYHRWTIPETCFLLSLLSLGEAGVSQALPSAPTVAAILLPFAFKLQSVLWCILGLASELDRQLRTNRTALRQESQRAREFKALLHNRELSLASTRHEIRSALLLLNSAADLFGTLTYKRSDPLNAEALRYLRQAGSRVAAAVGDIPQARQPFDIVFCLQVEVCAARRRGLSVRLDLLPNLPSRITGHSAVISGVVAELLDNVARHAPRSDVVVTVGHFEPTVVVTVADNGPGIPTLDPLAPFQPGWHSPPNVRPYGGMGLATAKKTIESIGGSLIWDPAKPGTVMTIAVPLNHSFQTPTADDPKVSAASKELASSAPNSHVL